ncbi:MAG TPA: response regulator transcription factor [Chitinophagaceae bacterium]|nr:response regulator transcription factor [Chitinophagaceae bacterium]
MANVIKIVIIEDDQTIRDGYAYLLSSVDGFVIAASYSSAESAIHHLTKDSADVFLLDISLSGMSGLDAIGEIKKTLPGSHIIMLTSYEDPEVVFKALSRGAVGYLTKNSPTSKTIEAIREVMAGGGPMSPSVARLVIGSFQRNKNSPLSKREQEILEHISNGKSGTMIARELFIDSETVKTHIKNIYAKLNVNSKAEAIKTAKENKLI